MEHYKTIIKDIAQINHLVGTPKLTNSIEKLLNSTERNINLAILGQFKSGKSSLVNHLIGEDILPVGVVPVTAIVTQLRYGPSEKLIIRFNNKDEISISLDELPLYVTEKQNPENTKEVALAIIEHPVLQSFKNINIVDTPGLNSFYRHNSEATLQWLPYTSTALIAVSAERPLSEEDLNLIKGTFLHCPDIAIVLTKIDLFNDDELEEIKRHVSESLSKGIDRKITLFEYSIYENADRYRNEIISNLIRPLDHNFEEQFNKITRFKIRSCAGQSKKFAELALQAALKRENEKNLISNVLNEIKENKHHHEREMLLSGTAFRGEVREKLENIILPFQNKVEAKIIAEFQNNYHTWNGSLYQISRKFEQWLVTALEKEITVIDNKCFEQINQIIKDASSYFEYSALQFRQRLIDRLNQLFGVSLPDVSWQLEFSGIDKPDISVFRTFDSHLDSLLFFLPMRWFRSAFFNHFQRQIPSEIDKNFHRYISGLTGKIIKSIDRIHQQSSMFINNEEREIGQILVNDQSNYKEIQKHIAFLEEVQSNL